MWTRWNTPGSHLRNQNKHKNKKSINNKGTNKGIPSVDEMEQAWPGRGGYFLVKEYWGCAAGWGRIFTSGLTIMGLHF